jgi:hypothetical protein
MIKVFPRAQTHVRQHALGWVLQQSDQLARYQLIADICDEIDFDGPARWRVLVRERKQTGHLAVGLKTEFEIESDFAPRGSRATEDVGNRSTIRSFSPLAFAWAQDTYPLTSLHFIESLTNRSFDQGFRAFRRPVLIVYGTEGCRFEPCQA